LLKDLGIVMPPVTNATREQAKAHNEVTKASDGLTKAQDHLALVEASLAGKHHITAAESLKLKLAHEAVDKAAQNLKNAHQHLADVTKNAGDQTGRYTTLNQKLQGALGDTGKATTPLAVAQAQLSDAWDNMAKQVGPGLLDLFSKLVGLLARIVTEVTDLISGLFHIGEATINPNGTLAAVLKGGPAVAAAYRASGGLSGAGRSGVGGFGGGYGAHAAGGWVGLRGPEMALVGEKGPEYIIPNDRLGGGQTLNITHRTILQLDGSTLIDYVERHLGLRLNLRGTSTGLGGR
jgi:hypothetical protein